MDVAEVSLGPLDVLGGGDEVVAGLRGDGVTGLEVTGGERELLYCMFTHLQNFFSCFSPFLKVDMKHRLYQKIDLSNINFLHWPHFV